MGRFALFLAVFSLSSLYFSSHANLELKVITVATEVTDGFRRFMRSAELFKIDVKVLGMDKEWTGGDVRFRPGGGQKVNLLREALRASSGSGNDQSVVLFTDSYDVVLLNSTEEILRRFTTQFGDARIVFSAEPFCWPDASLADRYPSTSADADELNRYLNSGGFIGYASSVLSLLDSDTLDDADDDQLFYTRLFLDPALRNELRIVLDTRATLFQALNGAVDDVVVRYTDDGVAYVYNLRTGTRPIVLHGNGPVKNELNMLTNYVPQMYSPVGGCLHCVEQRVKLDHISDSDLPMIHLGLLIVRYTPFIDEFFQRIASLRYPQSRMRIFISDVVEAHRDAVERFATAHSAEYDVLERIGTDWNCGKEAGSSESATECDWRVRAAVVDRCVADDARYYLQVDGHVHLDNPDTLRLLIEQNRTWLAPVITRPESLWSTFWGAISSSGYYARSQDYEAIVQRERVGIWNVPFVSGAYLVHGGVLKSIIQPAFRPSERSSYPAMLRDDAEVALAYWARQNGAFMWATNTEQYGHLVNNDGDPAADVRHPDLFERERNRFDWERRYVHENYWHYREAGIKLADFEQPCTDVFWFPFVSPRFAEELVTECNHYGMWSDGSNKDSRLEGGYENVPTRDIHMRQIGFEQHWLGMLRDYVRPIVEVLFAGYYSDAQARMNFVVRYKPDEQPSLRPHHDSSTYTLNVALNARSRDYEGGGCRFLRYNCSVLPPPDRVGWTLIHPGRLTHLHEGLPTTRGIRYIMVSFVDP